MNKNQNSNTSCKTFSYLYTCVLSIVCLSKFWVFLTVDEIKVFVRVSYILIRNILIDVLCLNECCLLIYP